MEQARIWKIDWSKVVVSCGGGCQAWLCTWCYLLLSPEDWEPGVLGSVTDAACKDDLKGEKMGL